jgi:hypothetical protein
MKNRAVYNLRDLHSSQEGRGVSCRKLLLADIRFFSGREYFVNRFNFRNAAGEELSGAAGIIFIELSKFNKVLKKPIAEMTALEIRKLNWRIHFTQFTFEQRLIRQMKLVIRDERRRHTATQGILHNSVIFSGAEDKPNTRIFIRLPHIAVEGFKIKFKLPQMLWHKIRNLQLDSYKARQPAIIKQEVYIEIFIANLNTIFFANERKVLAEL